MWYLSRSWEDHCNQVPVAQGCSQEAAGGEGGGGESWGWAHGAGGGGGRAVEWGDRQHHHPTHWGQGHWCRGPLESPALRRICQGTVRIVLSLESPALRRICQGTGRIVWSLGYKIWFWIWRELVLHRFITLDFFPNMTPSIARTVWWTAEFVDISLRFTVL